MSVVGVLRSVNVLIEPFMPIADDPIALLADLLGVL